MSAQTEIQWGEVETLEEASLDWTEYKFHQVVDVIDSMHKTPKYSTTGYPMVRVTDVKKGGLDLKNTLKVDKDVFEEFSRNHRPAIGDIVFTRVGSYGNSSIVKTNEPFCLGQNTVFIVPKQDAAFLYYYLNSPEGQSQIEGSVAGSTQPTISLKSIKDFDITLPGLAEQRAIAAVLSSLDDKIDLLHRQNATLEVLAETLFRQWFVEEAKEDWEEGYLGDLFTLQRGFDLPIQNRAPGKFPILTSSGYSAGHNEFKIKGPGVTTGRSGVIGKVFFVMEDFWPLNTSLFIKEYKLGTPLFSYFTLKFADLEGFNAGSAVPILNRNHVHAHVTPIPPKDLINRFEEVAYPHFRKTYQNTNQIQTLYTLRDTLLPKLMSGEVRVAY
ncbi:restriction modification system DNA specificity domain [Hymenobacter roseosalivarius DSM 11622]|uniref:Restriction modification system DNA specificity domain n=1 Tax=Hymenobacter roseosalivarius DSM 11622 TaxID=645990 RepID=A0A1W1VG97_9BACT|nr:restriction endonuclease subunit S [Hymenobacter roseosalivarius]SMB92240.1 restriction modification system DNA specificity domain [Hymenobacter roseosalivarius DSM 11622]